LLTHNLHGHQLNHQINRREAGGYNSGLLDTLDERQRIELFKYLLSI
jgi:hypothetical protein